MPVLLSKSTLAHPKMAVLVRKRVSTMAIGMVANFFLLWVGRWREGGWMVDSSSTQKGMHSDVCINKNTNCFQN